MVEIIILVLFLGGLDCLGWLDKCARARSGDGASGIDHDEMNGVLVIHPSET